MPRSGISNFARADELDTYAGEDFNTFTLFSAQYIRFNITSNHGDVSAGGQPYYALSMSFRSDVTVMRGPLDF
jgi:hypothetical protein